MTRGITLKIPGRRGRHGAALFFICFALFLAPSGTEGAEPRQASVPRVVLTPFTAEDQAIGMETAVSLSDMLMVRLGDIRGIELIDRSMINRVMEEISLNMGWLGDSSRHILSGRLLGSDFTVTGHLFTREGSPFAAIAVIDTRTGIIEQYRAIPVNLKQIDLFMESVCRLVGQIGRSRPTGRPDRRYVSIGRFMPLDRMADDQAGMCLKTHMIERYAGHREIGVVSRTHLSLLLQEIDLKKFKHVNDQSTGLVRDVEIASVQVDGYYQLTPESAQAILYITVPGKVHLAVPVRAGGLADLLDSMGKALDSALEIPDRAVSQESIKKAEEFRKSGLARLDLSYPKDARKDIRGGRLLDRKHAPIVALQRESAEKLLPAIDALEAALTHDPNDYQAMFPLALCYLSDAVDREGLANRLLQRVMIGTTDPDLHIMAQKSLVDFKVSKSAFSEITANPEKLHSEAMANLHYDQEWEMPLDPFSLRLTPDFEPVRLEAFAILSQAFLNLDSRIQPPPVACDYIKDHVKASRMDTRVRREAGEYYIRGKVLANIDYSRKDALPVMDTSRIGGDEPANRRMRVQNAVFEFESALLIQPDYYEAMLFLAFCLQDRLINETARAEQLFSIVAAESKHDTLRFLAAVEIDAGADMDFEPLFQAQLTNQAFFLKKYEQQIDDLSAAWSDGRLKDPAALQKALLKGMAAGCYHVIRAGEVRLRHGVPDRCAAPLVKAIKLADKSPVFSETRQRMIDMLFDDYPQAAPFIISYAQPYLDGDYTLLTRTLDAIDSGAVKSVKPLLFHKQLAKVYAQSLTAPVVGQDIEKIGRFINIKFPELEQEAQLCLINNLFAFGDLDAGRAYIEEHFPVMVDIQYTDTIFTSSTKWLQKSGVLEHLKDTGYLDNEGKLTAKFKGLTDEFYKDLDAYDSSRIENIGQMLQQAINIRIQSIVISEPGHNEIVIINPGLRKSQQWSKIFEMAAKVQEAIRPENEEQVSPSIIWEITDDIGAAAIEQEQGWRKIPESSGLWEKSVSLFLKDFRDHAVDQDTLPAKKISGPRGSYLGCAVAMNGHWAAVGSNQKDAVYVFQKTGDAWEYKTSIAGNRFNQRHAACHFGAAVDLSGDLLPVGSPLATFPTPYSLMEFKDVQFQDPVDVEALLDTFYEKGYIDRYHRLSQKFLALDAVMKKKRNAPVKIPASLVDDFPEMNVTDLVTAWEVLREGKSRKQTGIVHLLRLTENGCLLEATLLPGWSKSGLGFGTAVAVCGDHAAVGAGAGGIWFFSRTAKGWEQNSRFDHPCLAVDMTDTWAVAGTGGRAYIYKQEGEQWIQRKIIKAEEALDEAGVNQDRRFREPAIRYFGQSVAVSGDLIFIGSNGGSALVYQRVREDWAFHSRLSHDAFCDSDLYGCGYFETTLAASGKNLLIGTLHQPRKQMMPDGSERLLAQAGAAYLFTPTGDGWSLEKALSPADAEDNDRFGFSLAISGDDIVVGSQWMHSRGEQSSGGVYFSRLKPEPSAAMKVVEPTKTMIKTQERPVRHKIHPQNRSTIHVGLAFLAGIALVVGLFVYSRRKQNQ